MAGVDTPGVIRVGQLIWLVDLDGEIGIRVYENSGTMCTEQPITREQAGQLVEHLTSWVYPEKAAKPLEFRPKFWPPHSGEQWEDSRGDRWMVFPSGRLVCLSDDRDQPIAESAENVNVRVGPLSLYVRSHLRAYGDGRCPF
jgi:hypothetical protein